MNNIISLSFDPKKDYKYPVFLFALILFFFITPLLGLENNLIIVNVFYLLMVLVSIPVIQTESKMEKRIALSFALLGIVLTIIDILFSIQDVFHAFPVFVLMLFSIYFIILFKELVIQVIYSKKITFNVVFGAFTGYILLGIIGFFIFRMIHIIHPESFQFTGNPFNSLLYYSFITLTTIGYGDISPLLPSARYFAILLGLVGQFYNVIILAFIVGKFLQSSS